MVLKIEWWMADVWQFNK